MGPKLRRRLIQLAISAAVAAVTPAAAAGLVEGVSAAATTVADATAPSSLLSATTAIAPNDSMPGDTRIATGAPVRLSPLAGEDDTAWADANSVPHKHGTAKR
ncbi:MAG TPA: hypothetical protein VGG48_20220 [Rhizomicrobium sp.]